jgi:hypothetical protein
MKRYLWIFSFILILFASASFSAGLGDTLESVRDAYGKHICDEVYAFGNPPHAGRLSANAKGLFGADPKSDPISKQFFDGVKKLIPSDSILTATYKKDGPSIEEFYIFVSKSLSNLPDIKEAFAYNRDFYDHPIGTFYMIVNYDSRDKDRITCFVITLGRPEEVDIEDMQKISKNPFVKSNAI